jgi:N-methylhydantoinase A
MTTVGIPTGTTAQQAALGVLSVAVRNMVSAIRSITTQRGLDPRDFVLVACGGAGPVHAGLVAEELRIPRVMIPTYPALLSARGMLLADYRTDLSLTYPALLSDVDGQHLTELFEELEVAGCARLPSSEDNLSLERVIEVCYDGQQTSVPLTLPSGVLSDYEVARVGERLDHWFLERYGFVPKSNHAKIVNLRAFLHLQSSTTARLRDMEMKETSQVMVPATASRRMAFRAFPEGIDTPVHDRAQMVPHQLVEGPCVVEEDFSTTVVYPGQRAYSDEVGNLFILTGEF